MHFSSCLTGSIPPCPVPHLMARHLHIMKCCKTFHFPCVFQCVLPPPLPLQTHLTMQDMHFPSQTIPLSTFTGGFIQGNSPKRPSGGFILAWSVRGESLHRGHSLTECSHQMRDEGLFDAGILTEGSLKIE